MFLFPLPAEINPFIINRLGQMKVTDNPTYLPADVLVSPCSTLERAPTDGQFSSADPVYASTVVKYPSMLPVIGNAMYDTLASSQDNLLADNTSHEQLGSSQENLLGSSSTGNSSMASDRNSINVGKALSKASSTQEEGGTLVNPYATVDIGEVMGSELQPHKHTMPSNNSRGEYDTLEKLQ